MNMLYLRILGIIIITESIYLSYTCNEMFDVPGIVSAIFLPYINIPNKLTTCKIIN